VITGAFAAQKHDLRGLISRLPLEALRPGLTHESRPVTTEQMQAMFG
jgi:hypothetical protein